MLGVWYEKYDIDLDVKIIHFYQVSTLRLHVWSFKLTGI